MTESLEDLEISGKELSELLFQIYVKGSFAPAGVTEKISNPVSVKKRGFILCAREAATQEFSGIVIIVLPASRDIVRAKENECKMHLLGVTPKFKGKGLGRTLVTKAIEISQMNNWSKVVL